MAWKAWVVGQPIIKKAISPLEKLLLNIWQWQTTYNFLLSHDLKVGCDTQLINMRKNKIFGASTHMFKYSVNKIYML